MFGKNKQAILYTHLIVKVRKYKNTEPYFGLYTVPAIEMKLKQEKQLKN